MKLSSTAATRQDEFNSLMKQALAADKAAWVAREQAQELLGLDESNWRYFFYLYLGKFAAAQKRSIRIFEKGSPARPGLTAYPTAIAPRELMKNLKQIEYTELEKFSEDLNSISKKTALWVKKMQAGSGSSLTRTSYLSKQLGIPESKVRIGAKGTDLKIEIPHPTHPGEKARISIAEAQILQSIRSLELGEVGEVIFHDIVSSETQEAMNELWNQPSLFDPKKTYRSWVSETPGASHFGKSFQSFLPTLDEAGNFSFNRKAPGGHALFAVDALRAAYRPELRPKTSLPLVSAISNGEDLSSAPDPLMIGHMVKNRVPIVLVMTERTAVDSKGGILSFVTDERGDVSLTVLETAQASEAGQDALFASLPGFVNTNLALFNYEVLAPLITQEVVSIGEDEFSKIICPDVISNTKSQKDSDGVTRKYVQLEGAMGSTLMNLDRYWRKKHGEPLVHVINVDRQHRTEFFSPIKSAFDYFMQFHSDRFEFDSNRFRLKNLRPGELPMISLKDAESQDKYYQDVENILEAFSGSRIRYLDELVVEGKSRFNGAELRGKVRIEKQKIA